MDVKEQVEITDEINSYGKDKLVELITFYEGQWKVGDEAFAHPAIQNMVGFEQLCTDVHENGYPKRIEFHVAEDRANKCWLILIKVLHRLRDVLETKPGDFEGMALSKVHMENMPALSLGERTIRVMKQVDRALKRVRAIDVGICALTEPRAQQRPCDTDPDYFAVVPISSKQLDDMSSFQRSLCAALNEAAFKGYWRYKGNCYVQIKTEDGKFTRAWEPVMSIEDFVRGLANKELHFERWKDMTSKAGTINDVIRHLTVCKDHQFPEIVKDRHTWSFKNGFFHGRVWSEELQAYTSKFYPYDSLEFQTLDSAVVASKYFDQEFVAHDDVTDWYDIPTPHFQSVLDYQKFEEDVCRWTYVMVGRLCFEVGDLDGWQIIPFMKGIARSGKSTIITKVAKKFYESDDVRTLSNNIETKFGLSSICDGLMFIAPEIKADIKLEQAEFQSIVSGEDVSIARKHEKAKSMVWIVPGILAGNQIPNWSDNAGSILRRILPWNFSRQVKDADTDTQLDKKLDDELPSILEKCVKAYLDYAGKYSEKDIWNVVPQYFKKVQDEMAKNVSALIHFLEQPEVRYGADLCIPQKEFVSMFQQHCALNNLGKPRFNEDFYAGPFSTRDIVVEHGVTRMWEGRQFTNQPFIMGLTVDREDME